MSASKLDAVYRSILLTKFFTKGWGKPENLKRLFEFRKVVSNRDECFKLIDKDYPVTITKEQTLSDCRLLEGYFTTPLERLLPGIVPEIAQKAHFQVMLPVRWPDPVCKPVCLHLAGTGDHFFWRRRNLMVKPLLKEAGIGGIILENPFYGLRKPVDQVRSSLHNVSDIFVMGGCLILEALVLFHWCEQRGLGPLGVTGLSMGGHMASLAATNWPKPLVLVPCLSWSTASAVFLQGVMSHSINWDLLEDQYLSDGMYREKLSKMVTIVDESFLAGKKFAQKHIDTNDKPNVDITYKEPKLQGDIVDVSENLIRMNKVADEGDSTKSFAQRSNLEYELKLLLNEKKISEELYEKLVSNEAFQLDPLEIGDINRLTEEKIKDLLLRLKVADVKNQLISTTNKEKSLENSLLNSNETSPKHQTNQAIDETKQSTDQTNESPEPQTREIIGKSKEIKLVSLKKPRKWNVSDLTSDLWSNIPFLKPSAKKIDITKIHWRDREALQFMRGVMDECTHLSNFSVPYDTSLIIAVCARHDAYVPREGEGALQEIWPGAEVRYVDAGHVSAYILHQSLFRACIIEAFERSKKKWKDGKHID